MLVGFAAAFSGDWFLAVKASPADSPGFLAGVGCFALAHVLWMAAQLWDSRPDMRAFAAFAPPLVLFAAVRLAPRLPPVTAAALAAYALVSAASLAVAFGTRRRLYLPGIGLLVFSDVMIGAQMLHVPGCGMLVGPAYVLAEALLLASCLWRGEPRIGCYTANARRRVAALGGAAAIAVFAAVCAFPAGVYNPCMRMLSALGRTVVAGVAWPYCHYFFTVGLFLAASAAALAMLSCRGLVHGRRRVALDFAVAANFAGILSIAAVPENVNVFLHNAGCHLAAAGGGVALLALDRRASGRGWTVALVSVLAVFVLALALHEAGVVPFAPAVPTMQKLLIGSFAAWAVRLSLRSGRVRGGWLFAACALASAALVAAVWLRPAFPLPAVDEAPSAPSAARPEPLPLSADERAALAWLERVTGPLGADEEREWWDVGGSQHGIFAKRYNIAFAGYAAAAIGMRGDVSVRARVGKILGRCIGRMIRRDVWAYSQSRDYWGGRPWAPDPCHRENVMYTRHLLHLLAYYELFTGDRRYHRGEEGWDFVWRDGRRVHYDVERLIEATVFQMRRGPNGGVACEPGLIFFPCNNHPHVALSVFRRLGCGDWSADAARWERWALSHYFSPALGGGAVSLVYHVRGNFMYPRGQDGLDGWSFLWYEAWASDRRFATALWRRVRDGLDWSRLDACGDACGKAGCCDPEPVPASVAAVFLAAAARACDDPETAERLERAVDGRYLRREGGFLWLDVGREWRIGASAMRIVSLAESRGSRFREIWYNARHEELRTRQ